MGEYDPRVSSSTCSYHSGLLLALGVLVAAGLMAPVPLAAHDVTSLLERIARDDAAAHAAAARTIDSERAALIAGLIEILKAGDPTADASGQPSQITAIALLGRLRARESVPALVRYLGFRTWDSTGQGNRTAKPRLIPLDEIYGAVAALIAIGRPATPALLDLLARSDNPTLWTNALWALQNIEGHEALRLRIQKRHDNALTDAERRRLERYLEGLEVRGDKSVRE